MTMKWLCFIYFILLLHYAIQCGNAGSPTEKESSSITNLYGEYKDKGTERSPSRTINAFNHDSVIDLNRHHFKEDYFSHVRSLSQSKGDFKVSKEFECTLDDSLKQTIFDESLHVWTIDDKALKAIGNDVQSVIECTSEGDTILFDTTERIKPTRTLLIQWMLTLHTEMKSIPDLTGTSNAERPTITFTCPDSGNLIISKSPSLVIANIVFSDCLKSGSIVELTPKCAPKQAKGTTRFVNVEFRNNQLTGNQRLLSASIDTCTDLEMNNVVLDGNVCEGSSCIDLTLKNNLKNVTITRNSGSYKSLFNAILFAPTGSKTSLENIHALDNIMRIFSVDAATVTIDSSHFSKSRLGETTTAEEDFKMGSVLSVHQSNASFKNSTFEKSLAFSGGAIYAYSHSRVVISGSTFSNNEAKRNGGAIYTDQNTSLTILYGSFLGNSATAFAAGGGSIYATDCPALTIVNCEFSNNKAVIGGSIGTYKAELVTISKSSFKDNKADWDGGAISLFNLNEASTISDTKFIGNTGDRFGGAIDLGTNATVTMENCKVSNNEAGLFGGGLYTYRSRSLTIWRSIYSNNKAKRHGGGIYAWENPNLTIAHSRILGNEAGEFGGGIYLREVTIQMLKGLVITLNKAHTGGGVAAISSSKFLCNMCIIKRNHAVIEDNIYTEQKDSSILVKNTS